LKYFEAGIKKKQELLSSTEDKPIFEDLDSSRPRTSKLSSRPKTSSRTPPLIMSNEDLQGCTIIYSQNAHNRNKDPLVKEKLSI